MSYLSAEELQAYCMRATCMPGDRILVRLPNGKREYPLLLKKKPPYVWIENYRQVFGQAVVAYAYETGCQPQQFRSGSHLGALL